MSSSKSLIYDVSEYGCNYVLEGTLLSIVSILAVYWGSRQGIVRQARERYKNAPDCANRELAKAATSQLPPSHAQEPKSVILGGTAVNSVSDW